MRRCTAAVWLAASLPACLVPALADGPHHTGHYEAALKSEEDGRFSEAADGYLRFVGQSASNAAPVLWVNRSQLTWPYDQYSISSDRWPAFATGYRAMHEDPLRHPLPGVGEHGLLFHGPGGIVCIDSRTGNALWTVNNGGTYSATYAAGNRLVVWDGQAQALSVYSATSGTQVATWRPTLDAYPLNRHSWLFGGHASNTVTLVTATDTTRHGFDILSMDIDTGCVTWRRPANQCAMDAWPLLTRERSYWVTPDHDLTVLDNSNGTVTNIPVGLPVERARHAYASLALRPTDAGGFLLRFAPSSERSLLLRVVAATVCRMSPVEWTGPEGPVESGLPLLDIADGLYHGALLPGTQLPSEGTVFLRRSETWSKNCAANGNLSALRRHRKDGRVNLTLGGVSSDIGVADVDGRLVVLASSGNLVCLDPDKQDPEGRALLCDAIARGVACASVSGNTNASVVLMRFACDHLLYDESVYLAASLSGAVAGPVRPPGIGYAATSNGDHLKAVLAGLPLVPSNSPVRRTALEWFRKSAGIEQCLSFDSRSPVVAGDGGRVLFASDPPAGNRSSKAGGRVVAMDAPMGNLLWTNAGDDAYSTVGLIGGFAVAGTGRLLCNGQYIDGNEVTVWDWLSGNRVAGGDWGNIGVDYAGPIQEYDNASPWRFRGIAAGASSSNQVCLLAVRGDELRGIDPATGRVMWQVGGLAGGGSMPMLSATGVKGGFLLAIPRGQAMDLSFRRWSDGREIWSKVMVSGRLHERSGPAVMAKWRNSYWVAREGSFRYWQVRPAAAEFSERLMRGNDAVKWFTIDPYTAEISIQFNNYEGGDEAQERAWRRRRDPWPYATLTPACFGNACGIEVAAMWRMPGDPSRLVLFLNNPTATVLTVDVRKLLSWTQKQNLDRLAMLLANLDRTYSEPGLTDDAKLAAIRRLVARLGAATHKEREEAEASLRREGSLAIPALEEAVGSEDPEVALRAKGLLRAAEGGSP